MPLDPSIILQAGNFPKFDPAQYFQLRELIGQRRRDSAAQEEDRDYVRSERASAQQASVEKQQRLGTIGTMAAGGDYAGAGKAALEAGDFDLAASVSKMDAESKKRLHEKVTVAAPLFATALGEPDPGKRSAILQAGLPALVEYGYTPEELAKIQPTDEFLRSAVANAQTLDQVLKGQQGAEGFTLGPGQQRFDATGRPIASGPPAFHAVTTPEGGTTTVFGAPGQQGGSTAPRPSGAPVGPQIEATMTAFMPGARVTSGKRSPAHNAEVGGAPNSDHLDDNARDFTPPKGVSMAQLANAARAKFPGFVVLNEGDHVHVARPKGSAPTGGPIVIKGPPPRSSTRMTPEEVAAEGLPDGKTYYRNKDGVPMAVSGQESRNAPVKPPPNKALVDYQSNIASLRSVQKALSLLDPKNNSPEAVNARKSIGTGTGMMGDWFTQRNDPKGSDFRSQIGRIGGIIIKDISGAAVSAAEDSRLAKWVPLVTDEPHTAIDKLRNLANEIENHNNAFDEIYNEENGYRPIRPKGTLSPKEGAIPTYTPAQAAKAPKGTRFKTTDGRVMVRQ